MLESRQRLLFLARLNRHLHMGRPHIRRHVCGGHVHRRQPWIFHFKPDYFREFFLDRFRNSPRTVLFHTSTTTLSPPGSASGPPDSLSPAPLTAVLFPRM